jgi:lipopolysaccharide transport system permease protein
VLARAVDLFRYRLLIQSLVSREIKARYRGSVLGFFWSFINPLLLLLTYGLVFTFMLRLDRSSSPGTDPYFLFLFCGILPWTWFSSSLIESSGVLIGGGALIKKVLFPAEVLPVVTVLANLVHFLFGLPILLFFLVYEGRLSWSILWLPLPLLVQFVFTLGLALLVSALTVHFRDIKDILGHLLHLWMFASAILYLYNGAHGPLRWMLRLNPMAHLVVCYQQIFFDGHFDHFGGLAGTAGVAILVYLVGAFLFDRLRDTLAEEI